jgi:hypothetical protein
MLAYKGSREILAEYLVRNNGDCVTVGAGTVSGCSRRVVCNGVGQARSSDGPHNLNLALASRVLPDRAERPLIGWAVHRIGTAASWVRDDLTRC